MSEVDTKIAASVISLHLQRDDLGLDFRWNTTPPSMNRFLLLPSNWASSNEYPWTVFLLLCRYCCCGFRWGSWSATLACSLPFAPWPAWTRGRACTRPSWPYRPSSNRRGRDAAGSSTRSPIPGGRSRRPSRPPYWPPSSSSWTNRSPPSSSTGARTNWKYETNRSVDIAMLG